MSGLLKARCNEPCLAVGLYHFALHHFSAADVRRVAVLNSTGGTEANRLSALIDANPDHGPTGDSFRCQDGLDCPVGISVNERRLAAEKDSVQRALALPLVFITLPYIIFPLRM